MKKGRKPKDSVTIVNPSNIEDVTDGEQTYFSPNDGFPEMNQTKQMDNIETITDDDSVQSSPCALYKRNEYGLIEGVDYKYNPDNTINWRAMIDINDLVPNREKFKNKTSEEIRNLDVSLLEDSEVLILLSGLKKLARLRGYNYVKFNPVKVEEDYVSVISEIEFIGNYETNGKEVKFQSMANATKNNVSGIFQNFLETLAENRAFARVIRNFLNINIVSREEMGAPSEVYDDNKTTSVSNTDPLSVLKSKVSELNWSFDNFKEAILKSNSINEVYNAKLDDEGSEKPKRTIIKDVEKWEGYNDIPISLVYSLISRVSDYIKQVRAKR